MTTMSYAWLTVDGEFHWETGEPDWPTLIGPEGRERVSMRPDLTVAAYVNGCGLNDPENYPRNIVGTCLLATLGAAPDPKAGTIVFVGWEAANTLRGISEIVPLTKVRADAIAVVHAEVRRALAGDPPREMSPSWGEWVREIAEHARTAPTPGITIRTVTLR